MAPPLTGYLSSEELHALDSELRYEFGPFVITPEREKEVRTMLALVDIEAHASEVATHEVAHLETQRARLLSLLSPMRKLPNETLLRIFQHVCEKNILQYYYPWLVRKGSPIEMTPTVITYLPVIAFLPAMAISSVCYRWRVLALSSPRLWANLAVKTRSSMDSKDTETFAGFTRTVTRYLERSGDWPLTLELAIDGSTESEEIPCLLQLTQHARRWKTFSYWDHLSLAECGVTSSLHFPILAELGLRITLEGVDCFKDCPKLRSLSIYGQQIGTTFKVPVIYNQLDHLHCGGLSFSELAHVLPCCPSLKSLELSYIHVGLGEGVPIGIRCNITSLALVNCRSLLDIVFSSFSFPSLTSLVVDGVYNGSPTVWPSGAFTSFVLASSCMITTFAFHGIFESDLDLIATLRLMPALLHLEVEQSSVFKNPITSHLLSSLTHDQPTSISLVPKLHSLQVICHFRGAFDDCAFISMVESRWFKPGSDLSADMLAMGRSSIRSVVLRFDTRAVDADIYSPLRILDTEGLRVVVSGTNGVQV